MIWVINPSDIMSIGFDRWTITIKSVSFYRPKLLNGLSLWDPFLSVCPYHHKQIPTAYTPVLTVGFEPTFSTYRYRYGRYKRPLVRQHFSCGSRTRTCDLSLWDWADNHLPHPAMFCCDWRTRTSDGGRPYSAHETDVAPASQYLWYGNGIEPSAQGVSILCSTYWATTPYLRLRTSVLSVLFYPQSNDWHYF